MTRKGFAVLFAVMICFSGALHAAPDIFVLSSEGTGTGTVSTYTLAGATLNSNLFTVFGGPTALGLSPSYIYVSLSGSNSINQYTIDGTLWFPEAISLTSPSNVVTRNNNSLYVADAANESIGWYDIQCDPLDTGYITGSSFYQLAMGGGNLYALSYDSELEANMVNQYDQFGDPVNQYYIEITNHLPMIMAVNDANTYMYFCNDIGTISRYATSDGTQDMGFSITDQFATTSMSVYGNNLYLANYDLGVISLYNATTGALIDEDFVQVDHPTCIVVVPEPCTYALFGLGLVALGLRRIGGRRAA